MRCRRRRSWPPRWTTGRSGAAFKRRRRTSASRIRPRPSGSCAGPRHARSRSRASTARPSISPSSPTRSLFIPRRPSRCSSPEHCRQAPHPRGGRRVAAAPARPGRVHERRVRPAACRAREPAGGRARRGRGARRGREQRRLRAPAGEGQRPPDRAWHGPRPIARGARLRRLRRAVRRRHPAGPRHRAATGRARQGCGLRPERHRGGRRGGRVGRARRAGGARTGLLDQRAAGAAAAGREAMKLLIATRNDGKVREIRDIFVALPFQLVFPADQFLERLPEEQDLERGSSVSEDAVAKARSFAARSHLPTLAEDSGLEVDALDGAPGVFSARWALKIGRAHVELQSHHDLVCRLLLEKKKKKKKKKNKKKKKKKKKKKNKKQTDKKDNKNVNISNN